MLRNGRHFAFSVVAALACTAASQAQTCELTTEYTGGNSHWGNMFNIIALVPLTLDSFDVHFSDENNPAPACVGTSTCSVNEVEVYRTTAGNSGYVGIENTAGSWTLIGSVQHTITTPLGTPQPLSLPLNLVLDPAGTKKYGMYVTATGATNTVTGLPNEFLNYTNGNGAGDTFENGEFKIRTGVGVDYPFNHNPAWNPRTWNGTAHYTLGTGCGGCSSAAFTYCTAGTSAIGCQALISSSGTSSATASTGFTVTAAGVEAEKSGLIFYSLQAQTANQWGNGTSFRCFGNPNLGRGTLQDSGGTAGFCDGTYGEDLNARWTTKPNHNPGSGATVRAQWWYRDPQSTSNMSTSFSDALEWTVCP